MYEIPMYDQLKRKLFGLKLAKKVFGEIVRMKNKVTIGVCLRNCENDVRKIVNRIYDQDFPHENMEVIFVDDGSEDNTLSSIYRYAPILGMNIAVYHHKWKGLGYSRNVVLRNAKGNYILWVDDGTIISKDYVKRNIAIMEKYPNVGIAKGVIGFDNDSSVVATLENMTALTFYNKDVGKFTTKLIGTGGSIYRTEAARYVGGFDENAFVTEDLDIAYRILSAGWQIYITPVKLFLEYYEKLKNVWNKSFNYGYGLHFVLHKHKGLREIIYKSTPPAGFLQGVIASFFAYKVTHKKIAFLLPIFFFSIKRTAFCLGFAKSHIDSYGYRRALGRSQV
jgi:glycosyltransferase involved in cell wall biosynthesis